MPENDIGTKQQILQEIHYRRDKQWQIFSWTSSFILGAIGGVVTLTSSDYFRLEWIHGVILSLAIICIAIYAFLWLNHNWQREIQATRIIQNIDNEKQLADLYKEPKNGWGYPHTIIGLTAIGVLFFNIAPCFLQSDITISYKPKNSSIAITVPSKTFKFKKIELDTAIKIFQSKIVSR